MALLARRKAPSHHGASLLGGGCIPPSALLFLVLAVRFVAADNEEGDDAEETSKANPCWLYVGMVLIVIILSVLFEKGQEALEEKFKTQEPKIRDMLLKMMVCLSRELMILGFIGLIVFTMTKTNSSHRISVYLLKGKRDITDDEEPISETFEFVHMFIFGVMMCYIIQSGLLAFQALQESIRWRDWEYIRVASNKQDEDTLYGMLKDDGYFVDHNGILTVLKQVSTTKNLMKRVLERGIFSANNSVHILQWRALRHEFLFPAYMKGEEKSDDLHAYRYDEIIHRLKKEDVQFFGFYEYLTSELAEEFAELIEIKQSTWVIASVTCLILPALVEAGYEWHSTIAACASWILVVFTYVIGAQVYAIYDKIVPQLPGDPLLCLHLFRGTSPSALKRRSQLETVGKHSSSKELKDLKESPKELKSRSPKSRPAKTLQTKANAISILNYWRKLPEKGNGVEHATQSDATSPKVRFQLAAHRAIQPGFAVGAPVNSSGDQPNRADKTQGVLGKLGKGVLLRVNDLNASFASIRNSLNALEDRISAREQVLFRQPLIDKEEGELIRGETQKTIAECIHEGVEDAVVSDNEEESDDDASDHEADDINTSLFKPQISAFRRSLTHSQESPAAPDSLSGSFKRQGSPQFARQPSPAQSRTSKISSAGSGKAKLLKRPMMKLETYVYTNYPDVAIEEERLEQEVSDRTDSSAVELISLCVRFQALPGADLPHFRKHALQNMSEMSKRKREFLKFLSRKFLKVPMKSAPNPQDCLFWFHEMGPHMFRAFLDLVLFFQAVVSAALLVVWFDSGDAWDVHQWVGFAIALAGPLFNITVLVPRVVGKMVIIRSVEYMKDAECCQEVVAESKKSRLLESLRLIQLAKLQGKMAQLGGANGKITDEHFAQYTEKFERCFTKKRKEELHKTFLMFDEDRSGTISIEEMSNVLSALGYDESRDKSATTLVDLVDSDNSKDISYEEYKVLMAMSLLKDNEEEERDHCKALFMKFDGICGGHEDVEDNSAEPDNQISIDELSFAFAKLGAPIDEDTIAELVRQVFGIYKQALDLEEFIKFIGHLEEMLEGGPGE